MTVVDTQSLEMRTECNLEIAPLVAGISGGWCVSPRIYESVGHGTTIEYLCSQVASRHLQNAPLLDPRKDTTNFL